MINSTDSGYLLIFDNLKKIKHFIKCDNIHEIFLCCVFNLENDMFCIGSIQGTYLINPKYLEFHALNFKTKMETLIDFIFNCFCFMSFKHRLKIINFLKFKKKKILYKKIKYVYKR
jgi:hypothetical protein